MGVGSMMSGGKGGGSSSGGGGGGATPQSSSTDITSLISQLFSSSKSGMAGLDASLTGSQSTAGTSSDYAALGLADTGGQNPAAAARRGKSLQGTGPSTAEQMDQGNLPSISGGIQAQQQANAGTSSMDNTGLGGLAQAAGFGAGYSGA